MHYFGFIHGGIKVNVKTKKHNNSIGTSEPYSKALQNQSDDFHLLKLDWSSEKLIFYIDENEIFKYNKNESSKEEESWPFDKEFNILFSFTIENKFQYADHINTSEYVIDYVRHFRFNNNI